MTIRRHAPSEKAPSTTPVSHQINREVILVLGWGRAILLQLAHPLVAQAVADHSEFDSGVGGHLRRFRHTLQAMLDLTFGSREEALRAAGGINRIHDRVQGRLPAGAGPWDPGTRYSAHDPKLLAWVHVTLLDSLLKTYELYVGPLTEAERDAYCREAASMEELLEMPPGVLPRSHRELEGHLRRVLPDGDVVVTQTSLRLAEEVLRPGGLPLRPFLWMLHLPTRGLLPSSVRSAYKIGWSRNRQALLTVTAFLIRLMLPLVPGFLRHWPRARRVWFPLLRAAERAASHRPVRPERVRRIRRKR